MTEWKVEVHPEFLKDLKKLNNKLLEIFYKKKEKIKSDPLRQKHLKGGSNCYREPITDTIRLIYYVEKKTIYLLTIGVHDKAYKQYRKRLHNLKDKIKQ